MSTRAELQGKERTGRGEKRKDFSGCGGGFGWWGGCFVGSRNSGESRTGMATWGGFRQVKGRASRRDWEKKCRVAGRGRKGDVTRSPGV